MESLFSDRPRTSFAIVIFCLALVSGCKRTDEAETTRQVFERHVESCVCRVLDYESENYRGTEYAEMLQECNVIVQQANNGHYSAQTVTKLPLEILRCSDDVESWQETLTEVKAQESSNRTGYREFLLPKNNDATQPNTDTLDGT